MNNKIHYNFTNALPENLYNFAWQISRYCQVDMALVVPALLGVGTSLVHDKFKVEVSDVVTKSSYIEPISLFCLGIADSSERKTSVLNCLRAPLQEALDEVNVKLEDSIRKQKIMLEIAENERQNLKKKVLSTGRDSSKGALLIERLQELEIELNAPKTELRRLFLQDTTGIAAAEFLQRQKGTSLTILDGEGAAFDSILSDHRLLELLLSGFSNENISFERSSKPSVVLQSPHVSLCVLTQEVKLKAISKKQSMWDEGFIPRSLIFIAPSMVGHRTTAIGEEVPQNWKNWWRQKCEALLHLPYNVSWNDKRKYKHLYFSSEAAQVWREFSNNLERMMLQGTDTYPLRAWLGKMPGVAARVASFYHLFDTSEIRDVTISGLHMQQACNLIYELIPTMQHVHSLYFPVDNIIEKTITKIINWIKLENRTIIEFKLRDMYRELNLDSRAARIACADLCNLGVLEYIQYPTANRGRKATPGFYVNYYRLDAHFSHI